MYLIIMDSLLAILLVVLAIKSFFEWVNPCFKKVSKEQYDKDMAECGWYIYMDIDNIPFPKSKTSSSEVYNFISPVDIELKPGELRTIPTGLRCRMNDDEVMLILPQSSTGTKQRVRINDTVGVIAADYYDEENEGHILIGLQNSSRSKVVIPKGTPFAQGLIVNSLKVRGASSVK